MDIQTKMKMIVSLMESFPVGLNYMNLSGNPSFTDWFIPRLEVLRESDYWDNSLLDDIRRRRLRNLLVYLNRESLFWRERFFKFNIDPRSPSILEDIRRLPVCDRGLYMKKDVYALPRIESQSAIHTRHTSGTTNTSMAVLISDSEISIDVLSCLFRRPSLDLMKVRELLERKFFFFLGRTVLPHYASFARGFSLDNFTKLSDPDVRKEIYKILKKEPQILWTFSTIGYEFAHYLASDGEKLPLLATYIHSETTSKDEKVFIGKTLVIPVVNLYVSCETAVIGDECESFPGSGYFHIPRERALIEVLDDNDLPVAEGMEGRLIVTVLDRKITPILRYANGDRGRLLNVSCNCGKKSQLFEMLGREGDRIILPGEKKFSALLLANNFLELAHPGRIKKYQIRQESTDKVFIAVVPEQEFFAKNEISIMESVLSASVGGGIKISIVHVNDIERGTNGKMRFFIPLKSN